MSDPSAASNIQFYLNIAFGVYSTAITAAVGFMVKDYLDFRFNLHKNLDDRYQTTNHCQRRHQSDDEKNSLRFSQLHDKIDKLSEEQLRNLKEQREIHEAALKENRESMRQIIRLTRKRKGDDIDDDDV